MDDRHSCPTKQNTACKLGERYEVDKCGNLTVQRNATDVREEYFWCEKVPVGYANLKSDGTESTEWCPKMMRAR